MWFAVWEVTKIGNSSLTIKLEFWVKPVLDELADDRYYVTEAVFT